MNKQTEGSVSSGIASLEKAVRILDCFDVQHKVLSLSEITKMTGYPKTTVHGLVSTLIHENMLARATGNQGYMLGIHLMELSFHARLATPVIQIIAPTMNRICAQTHQNVYLTTHHLGRLLYLESCLYNREYIGYSENGKCLPMHCTASGKAMLAYMTDDQLNDIVNRWPLEKKTPNTITDLSLLKNELENIRNRGFAVDMEEETIGVKCLAVPVLNTTSQPVGALSISGSVPNMTTAKIYEYSEVLLNNMSILRMNADLFPCEYLG